MSRRPRKVTWKRDYMAEIIRDSHDTRWGRYLAQLYNNKDIRKGFNDQSEK